MDKETNKGWGYTYDNQKEEMVLGGPYYEHNRQQMDKEGNGMATKKLQKEARAGRKSG